MKALFTVAPAHGAALQGDGAADPEARGAGAGGGSSERVTLRGRVASPIEIIGAATGRVWEADYVEYPLAGDGVE